MSHDGLRLGRTLGGLPGTPTADAARAARTSFADQLRARPVLAYAAAGLVGVLTAALQPFIGDRELSIVVWPVLVLGALLAGTGPGIFAALLASLAGELFFALQGVVPEFGPAAVVRILVLAITVGAAGRVSDALRRSRTQARIEAEGARAAAAALRNSYDRLAVALDAAQAGMSQWNHVTKELVWNDRQFEILGYQPRSFPPDRFSWRDRVHPEDLHRVVAKSAECSRQGVDYVDEYRVVWPNGEVHWVQSCRRYQYDAGGRCIGSIGAMFDITDHKRALEDLEQAKATADAANAAKDHFLAVLSHELRTPLTPALMAAQLMETDASLPPEVRRSAAVIRRNVELEARLIDDLLDLTRITRGKLTLQVATVDLHECVRQVLQVCEADVHSKRLTLEVQLDAGRACVEGDAIRLQQAIWNVLRNAIKFTPMGGLISVQTRNPSEDALVLRVQDTGIGIEPARLPSIFEAFQQGGAGIGAAYGGLGLGLTITKNILELHGGSVSASSEGVGQGTCFEIRLPASKSAAPHSSPEAASSPPVQDGQARRVLLVEDHRDTRAILARLLQKWGYVVTPARCLADALEAIRASRYDLLICDIGLPDGTGYELMQQIAPDRSMPGVALSGYGQAADILKSKAAGFCEHITKPIDFKTFHQMISRLAGAPAKNGLH